jgi:hypothetical protein
VRSDSAEFSSITTARPEHEATSCMRGKLWGCFAHRGSTLIACAPRPEPAWQERHKSLQVPGLGVVRIFGHHGVVLMP